MDWRQEVIAYGKESIKELRRAVKEMEAGTYEIRRFSAGSWHVLNREEVARAKNNIDRLKKIVEAVEKS